MSKEQNDFVLSFSLYLNQCSGPLNMGINQDLEDKGYGTFGTSFCGCTGSGAGVCSQVHSPCRHTLPIWHWLESGMCQRRQDPLGSFTLVQLNNDKSDVMNQSSLVPGGNDGTCECWKKLLRNGPPDFTVDGKLRNNHGL